MNCSATLLRATQAQGARTNAHGKAGAAASADPGADGTAPAQPFSAVLADHARRSEPAAKPAARKAVADAVPNSKARKPGRSSGGTDATATSGAGKNEAQDSGAPVTAAPDSTATPAPDPTPQTAQGASSTSTAVENPASGNAPFAPPAGEATAANAPAAEQAASAGPLPPVAQDFSDNATSPASTAPAGNAAPQSDMGTSQITAAGGGDSPAATASALEAASAAAQKVPSAQDAQRAGTATVPPPQADSSAPIEQAGGKPAMPPVQQGFNEGGAAKPDLSAEASAAPGTGRAESRTRYSTDSAPAAQSVSVEAPASTGSAVSGSSGTPAAGPRQTQTPMAAAPQGVQTAADAARPDALQTAGQFQRATEGPDLNLRTSGNVAQPAPANTGAQAGVAEPMAASVKEVIARLLSPQSGADSRTQPATDGGQGQPVAAPAAASRAQGTSGAAELAPLDDSSGSPEDAATSKTASSRASAAGAEEVIARVITRGVTALSASPWNDAATVLHAQSQEHSDSAKAAGVESLAVGQGAAVAHAMERAMPESPGRPANAPGNLNEAHFLDNIVRQARVLTRPDGASELTLSLQPPDLGTVVVRLTLKDDRLQGQLQVDSPSVRENLQSLVPAVKQALAGEGIDLDRLDVGVRGQGGQSTGQDTSGGRQAAQARSDASGGSSRSERGAGANAGVSVSAVGGVLSTPRASTWVGVMDFVA